MVGKYFCLQLRLIIDLNSSGLLSAVIKIKQQPTELTSQMKQSVSEVSTK